VIGNHHGVRPTRRGRADVSVPAQLAVWKIPPRMDADEYAHPTDLRRYCGTCRPEQCRIRPIRLHRTVIRRPTRLRGFTDDEKMTIARDRLGPPITAQGRPTYKGYSRTRSSRRSDVVTEFGSNADYVHSPHRHVRRLFGNRRDVPIVTANFTVNGSRGGELAVGLSDRSVGLDAERWGCGSSLSNGH